VHWWVVSVIQVAMGLTILAAIYEQQWLNVVVLIGIIGVLAGIGAMGLVLLGS